MSYGKTDRPMYWNFSEGKLKTKIDGNEIVADWIEGYITQILIKEDEYQGRYYKKVCISLEPTGMDASPVKYELQVRLDSGYGIAFCMVYPNIIFARPVKIWACSRKKTGRKKRLCLSLRKASR